MGLVERREAISAPTVGYASDSTPVRTARPKPTLASRGRKVVSVRKSSKRASAISTTHTAHTDQASQAAVRRLFPPTPRSCFLVPFVTTITLQDCLLPSITITVTEPLHGAATGPTQQGILLCPPVSVLS